MKETYAGARARLLSQLAMHGWTTAPQLKVPWAESPDKTIKLWFKAQAVYLDSHSLFIDMRGMAVETLIATAARTNVIRRDIERTFG